MASNVRFSNCLFCKIANGEEQAWLFWESDSHLAFLTPFPNTPGFTVVASRWHLGSDILQLDDEDLIKIVAAGKQVAKLLRHALGCERVALVAEGMGVDHAHLKLIPLHGLDSGDWKPVHSSVRSYTEKYEGYVSSHDGPPISHDSLDKLKRQLQKSQQLGG